MTAETRLMYSRANQAFVFTFGDQLLRIGQGPMFYRNKADAIRAALKQGLVVDAKGHVTSVDAGTAGHTSGEGFVPDRFFVATEIYEYGGGGMLPANRISDAIEKGTPISKLSQSDLRIVIKQLRTYLEHSPDGSKLDGPIGKKVDHKNLRRLLSILDKSEPLEGLEGTATLRTKVGTRVRFKPQAVSRLFYSNPPAVGEEGEVTMVAHVGGKRSYMKGPGGGLLYVRWDKHGTMGVAPHDVELLSKKAPPGPASGFGKEKTEGDYKMRIVWERWAAAQARKRGESAVATGHDLARKDYEQEFQKKFGAGLEGTKLDRIQNLDDFTRAYIEAALWSSTDNSDPSGGDPLDLNYDVGDLTSAALDRAIKDSKSFQKDNAKLLAQAGDEAQNGHDFWLTRNRHGAGFWDRGYGEVGDKLTEAAHAYGSVDLVVSGGKIHYEG